MCLSCCKSPPRKRVAWQNWARGFESHPLRQDFFSAVICVQSCSSVVPFLLRRDTMTPWQGKWALVTGASAGIGWALAAELAAGGTNLVLTARRRERLEQLAGQLRGEHKISVEILAADLVRPAAPEEVFAFTQGKGIAVELLVNNAGFGAFGEFTEIDLARQLEMVQVNISAVLHLTHRYLPAMIERRRGDILIVSSTAAFQGVPYLSTYAATKAFDLLFAEALAEEVHHYGERLGEQQVKR